MDKNIATVYETWDYDKFVKLEGNRIVLTRRISKILKSVEKVGYRLNPIIVNERFEIIDGQGRFEACKQEGLPIQYVIDAGAGLEECIALNLGQSNWSPIDYVRSYAEQGIEDYVRFLALIEAYPRVSLQILYGIATNTINTGGAGTKTMRNGELEFPAEWNAKIRYSILILDDLQDELRCIKGEQRVLQSGLAWVINNTSCDTKRLKKIMAEKYPLFHPVVNADGFLSQLADLYNKKLSPNKCIYFNTVYKQALKEA